MTNFLAALALCFSSVAIANSEFSDFFNSFETLSADFTQQTFSDSTTLLTKTSGYLHFKRPASFVWQTKTPIEQTLLLNNHELWLIDTELEQASQQATGQPAHRRSHIGFTLSYNGSQARKHRKLWY